MSLLGDLNVNFISMISELVCINIYKLRKFKLENGVSRAAKFHVQGWECFQGWVFNEELIK